MNVSTKLSSLGVKLPLIMSALVAVTVTVMTYLAYTATRDSIIYEADRKLESVAHLKKQQVETLLEGIDRDLRLNASNPQTVEALTAFSVAFSRIENPTAELQRHYITDNPHPTGEKDKLYSAQDAGLYDKFHKQYHPAFHRLQQEMGYYDVFLFDAEGNLVYTVFKELDYATNLLTGEWKDSGLGVVLRGALAVDQNAPSIFDDFSPYAPSAGAPAAFIARPVFDQDGERVGAIAFQMPVDEFNGVIGQLDDLGNTGDIFLVGADAFMRTDTMRTEENDILQTRADTEGVKRGLAGEEGLLEYTDYVGNRVMGYYAPVDFLGTRWALVTKQTTDELFQSLDAALVAEVINGLVMFLFAVVVTFFLSRSITRPLHALSVTVNAIRSEQYDLEVPAIARRDEIGGIAKSVEAFRGGLKEASIRARDAAFKGAAFETSGAPMLLVDKDFVITQINSAAIRMFKRRASDLKLEEKGADPDAMIGLSMDLFEELSGEARAAIKTLEELPFKVKLAVGEAYLGLFVDQVIDYKGEHIGFVFEWKDQTMEMAIQTVMKSIDAQQCRIEARLAGDIKAANGAFADIVGQTEDDLCGQQISRFVRPLDSSIDPWAQARDGESTHVLFHLEHGSIARIIEGSVSPIPDHKNRPNGFLFMGVDVTDARKEIDQAEEQRTQMEAQQNQVVQALSIGLRKMSEGDLTSRISEPFAADYEQLRHDFNGAVDRLLEALQSIVLNAEQIDDGAGSISSAVQSLSSRTEQQAATLEETAAAIEQLTGAVKSAAQGAVEAAGVAKDARDKAEVSGTVVNEAVAAMNEIENSSNEISKIIGVIDDIAFQTNLLALNAGVEAARAGEAGRGFAVVASEVRALAQRSLEAASDINALITASGDQVKTGVARVGDAGEALRRIVSSVAEIAKFVDDIATSSEEQSNGLGEINQAMAQLDSATQENAAMVEETTAATQALAGEAQVLTKTTSVFNIGEEQHTAAPGASKTAAVASAPAASVPVSIGATALKSDPTPELDDGWAEF